MIFVESTKSILINVVGFILHSFDAAQFHPNEILNMKRTPNSQKVGICWWLMDIHVFICFVFFVTSILAESCNYIASSASVIRCSCRLSSSETRVFCDKTAEVMIMQFSTKCIPRCFSSFPAKFNDETRIEFPRTEIKLGWGGFWLRDNTYVSKTVRDRA